MADHATPQPTDPPVDSRLAPTAGPATDPAGPSPAASPATGPTTGHATDPATGRQDSNWSPADNPYAIAVSEAQWWTWAIRLTVARLGEPDSMHLQPVSSRQVDARFLVLALTQLLRAETLEQAALSALDMDADDPDVRRRLAGARETFLDTLSGLVSMRDALTHFDEWARGVGRGPQGRRVAAGDRPRDVARDYWGFRFDPFEKTVSLGPHSFGISAAHDAAHDLSAAIYTAARSVDVRAAGPPGRAAGLPDLGGPPQRAD